MDKAQEIRDLLNKMFGVKESMMSHTATFPETVYVLHDDQDRYYQIRFRVADFDPTWGLVCFSQRKLTECFLESCERMDLTIGQLTFDEARETAQKHRDVGCLFLLDDPDDVGIHWVR